MADKVKDDIRAAGNLADATKKTLESRVNRLFSTDPFPKQILKKVIPSITGNQSSQLAYMQSVMSLSRISESFKKAVGAKQLRDILKESELLKEKENERREKGEKREDDIDWDDVKKCKDKFPVGSEARLIYLLYTTLPPVRADYTPMEIVDSAKDANDDQMNYYVRAKKPYILLNVYKTASKYGQQRLDVSKELADAIPRDQKFMFEFDGEPMQPNTLSKKVVRAFKKYCDLHVTINTLRRSYAKMTMGLSKEEQIDAAIAQGHSLSVHKEYSRRGKSDDDAEEK
jgi:hypothetical protein